jgi:hypothetical protein
MKWPFIGNLPQIAKVNWTRVWFAIDHYSKEYGDIYGMYFGPRYVGTSHLMKLHTNLTVESVER